VKVFCFLQGTWELCYPKLVSSLGEWRDDSVVFYIKLNMNSSHAFLIIPLSDVLKENDLPKNEWENTETNHADSMASSQYQFIKDIKFTTGEENIFEIEGVLNHSQAKSLQLFFQKKKISTVSFLLLFRNNLGALQTAHETLSILKVVLETTSSPCFGLIIRNVDYYFRQHEISLEKEFPQARVYGTFSGFCRSNLVTCSLPESNPSRYVNLNALKENSHSNNGNNISSSSKNNSMDNEDGNFVFRQFATVPWLLANFCGGSDLTTLAHKKCQPPQAATS
jgi:hypothetical protein